MECEAHALAPCFWPDTAGFSRRDGRTLLFEGMENVAHMPRGMCAEGVDSGLPGSRGAVEAGKKKGWGRAGWD